MNIQISSHEDYLNLLSKDSSRRNGVLPFAFCYYCGLETTRKNGYGITECIGCAEKRAKHAGSARLNNTEIDDYNSREWRIAIR